MTSATPACLGITEKEVERSIVIFNSICLFALLARQSFYYRYHRVNSRDSASGADQLDPFLLPLYASVLGVAAALLVLRMITFGLFDEGKDGGLISMFAITVLDGTLRVTIAAYLVQKSSGVRAMQRAASLGIVLTVIHGGLLSQVWWKNAGIGGSRHFFGIGVQTWLQEDGLDCVEYGAMLAFMLLRAHKAKRRGEKHQNRPGSMELVLFLNVIFASYFFVELYSALTEGRRDARGADSSFMPRFHAQTEAISCWDIGTSGFYYLCWPPMMYWALRQDSLQWRYFAVRYGSGGLERFDTRRRAGAQGSRDGVSGVQGGGGGGGGGGGMQNVADGTPLLTAASASAVSGGGSGNDIEEEGGGDGLRRQLNDHFGQDFAIGGAVALIDFLKLEIKDCIGSGSSAKVYRASLCGRTVAVKRFRPSEITPDAVLERMVEVDILAQVKHVCLSTGADGVCLSTGADGVCRCTGQTPERGSIAWAGNLPAGALCGDGACGAGERPLQCAVLVLACLGLQVWT
jgi:hypothetical protein